MQGCMDYIVISFREYCHEQIFVGVSLCIKLLQNTLSIVEMTSKWENTDKYVWKLAITLADMQMVKGQSCGNYLYGDNFTYRYPQRFAPKERLDDDFLISSIYSMVCLIWQWVSVCFKWCKLFSLICYSYCWMWNLIFAFDCLQMRGTIYKRWSVSKVMKWASAK